MYAHPNINFVFDDVKESHATKTIFTRTEARSFRTQAAFSTDAPRAATWLYFSINVAQRLIFYRHSPIQSHARIVLAHDATMQKLARVVGEKVLALEGASGYISRPVRSVTVHVRCAFRPETLACVSRWQDAIFREYFGGIIMFRILHPARAALCAMAFTLTLGWQATHAQSPRPMVFDDMLRVKRIGGAVVSPDGKYVAYTQGVVDKAANRVKHDIWVVPAQGGEPRQLTNGERSSSDPCWSPDSKSIAFVSNRDGSAQAWIVGVEGGEPRKITNFYTDVSGLIWSPDGKWLAFASDIYPECSDDECNKRKLSESEASKVKAKIAERLLYRHWTSFKEGRRSHIFTIPANGGAAKDVTPGDYDAPPFSLGGSDYAFSPDGAELAFARNTDKDEATSTNNDIFLVPVGGGEAKRISTSKGSDVNPRYSPDGKYIAWLSQDVPTFEADRKQVILYDRQTGQLRRLSDKIDISFDEIVWAPDGKLLFLTAERKGQSSIFTLSLAGNESKLVWEPGQSGSLSLSPDGATLYFTNALFSRPAEVFSLRAAAGNLTPTQLTHVNDAFLSEIKFGAVEDMWFEGAGGTKVHALIVKPPQFEAGKKYPMITLIHGGPQSAWTNGWSYRWNPQMFAAPGYVALMINPRGSTGYGQKFTDEISGDWGGKVYTDLMHGVDAIIKQGYVDENRIGAAGGSYGGYMINWILGHNQNNRFKALVSHAGVYNLESMYGATEELWFTEWEFKGNPWDHPKLYEKWSPHRFAKHFDTPTLVIHGELDYRVPVGEGLQLFTALQRRNTPSKLLYFPDEGHWVLKPQNSEMWYKNVHEWFGKYLQP